MMSEPLSDRSAADGARPLRVVVVGAGLIGASWVAAFLAGGCEVTVTDPAAAAEAQLHARLAAMWQDLRTLDPALPEAPPLDRLSFARDLGEAVAKAEVVQECIPEQLEAKRDLFARLDEHAPADALLLSSTSAIRMSDIQSACSRHPERCVVGHPFNPPHLIPLVEVVGGERTGAEAIARAMEFYRAMGKRPVHVRKEVAGHVANRLQAALMREVVDLVEQGVVDVADVDAVSRWGPGLRWALLGPVMVAYLGTPEHRREQFPQAGAEWLRRMWGEELSTPEYGPDTVRTIAHGIREELAGRAPADVEAERDRLLLGLLSLLRSPAA